MTSSIDEETNKAWEILTAKKRDQGNKIASQDKGKEKVQKKEEKKIEEQKTEDTKEIHQEEQEKAAVWLTGGLEEEIRGPGVIAPVFESSAIQPVSSLDDFASTIPSKKEEDENKGVRMYETQAQFKQYETTTEAYEETAENLFSRMIKPLDTRELKDIPRFAPTELMGGPRGEARESVKYIEMKHETSELPFLKTEKREIDVRKYRKFV